MRDNLYLDRLEASFVDQLHRFKRLRTFCLEQSSWDPNTSLKLSSKTCKTSGQFKVLRDGRWLKINFKRNLPSVDTAPDSCDVLNSPWIRHFKRRGKGNTGTYNFLWTLYVLKLQWKLQMMTLLFKQIISSFFIHQNMQIIEDPVEVSDQNFVDGGQVKPSSKSMATKFMTAGADVSTKTQIVPSGKY